MRSVEVHDQPVARAEAGPARGRCAWSGVERGAIPRGAVLATPGRFPRATGSTSSCGRSRTGPASRTGALVQVLAGTACVDARVALLEADALAPGSTGLAQLRLRELVAAARGDRVIVRATSPQATIAGGVVLDPAPARHGGERERARRACGCWRPATRRRSCGRRSAAAPWPLRARADCARRAARLRRRPSPPWTSWCESGEVLRLARQRARLADRRRAMPRCASRCASLLARRAAEHPLEPALPAAARRARRCRRRGPARSPRGRRRAAARRRARAARRRAAPTRGGRTPRRPRPLLAALAAADSRRPTCLPCASPRACPSGSSRRSARRSSASGADRPLRRRPGLHERALRRGARARRRALQPSTGRSRWPRCATTSARAGASRRACSSASTRTASRAASAIAACCAGAPRRNRPAGPDRPPAILPDPPGVALRDLDRSG